MRSSRLSRILILALVTLFALVGALPNAQAGWTQPVGGYYLKLWVRSLIGSSAYLVDGSNAALPDSYSDHALNIYAEYGLIDDLTLAIYSRPLGFASYGDESTVYLGETRLGVRRGLLSGRLNLALQADYGFAPDLGATPIASGVVGGFPFVYAPTVETHRLDGTLQFGMGLPFGWFSVNAGVTWFSASGVDVALDQSATLGWSAEFGLDLSGYVVYHHPLGEIEVTSITGTGQTRFFGFGIDLCYWVGRGLVGIAAGVGAAALAESNAATPSLNFGVAIR